VVVVAKGFVESTVLPDGKEVFSGLAIDVFEAALDRICDETPASCWAKREVSYYPTNAYGTNTSTGQWSGAIGELQAGRADVGVGDINENLLRSRVVTFTGSWLDAPLAFLASPVTPLVRANLWGWLRPFSYGVWLSLLSMTALFAVSLAWLERFSPFSFRNLPPVRGREELRQRVNLKDTWHVRWGLAPPRPAPRAA
jgi:ABC-type amino acid transport substrate-binding protein